MACANDRDPRKANVPIVTEPGEQTIADGETRTRRVNVPIVAATNRELQREVEAAASAKLSTTRLAVFPIELPPLRVRRGDVGALAAHFIASAERKLGKKGLRLTNRHVQALERHAWPSNVREVASVVERAVILARDGRLAIDALLERVDVPRASLPSRPVAEPGPVSGVETEHDRKQRERANIEAALAACGGKVYGAGGAAEMLGVRPTTLASRIRVLGLVRRR